MSVFVESFWAIILFDALFIWRGGKALAPKPWLKYTFYSLIAALFALYFVGLFGFKSLGSVTMRHILNICNTYYFIAIYAVMGLILCELLALLDRFTFRWFYRSSERNKRKVRYIAFTAVLLSSLLIVASGMMRVAHPQITHLSLSTTKRTPACRDSVRIAFISDVHIGESIRPRHIRSYVDQILRQKPDILLVGGDLFDYFSCYGYDGDIIPLMRDLASEIPLGVYMVMGNHDYRADTPEKVQWVKDCHAHLLIDTAQLIDNCFYLVGRDDATQRHRKEVADIMANIDKSLPIVYFEHQPKELNKLPTQWVDLALYGHTHDGQIWPFKWIVEAYFPLAYGYRRIGNTHFYVSSGIGAAGPAIRVGTRSEIVVIDLVFGAER